MSRFGTIPKQPIKIIADHYTNEELCAKLMAISGYNFNPKVQIISSEARIKDFYNYMGVDYHSPDRNKRLDEEIERRRNELMDKHKDVTDI